MTELADRARRAVGVTGESSGGSLAEALLAGPGLRPLLTIGLLGGVVLGQGAVLLHAPEVALSLGLSTRSAGALLSVWAGGVVLALPFALRAALGQRRAFTATAGAVLSAVALVLLSFSTRGWGIAVAAALAGMLYAGRLQSGRFQLGEGDELSVIAAAVLGGTSLFGGRGTVIGSIIGALMIGVINNGLILMGLEYSQQLIARGLIIIVAVAISQAGIRTQ